MKVGHAWHSALLDVDVDSEETRPPVYKIRTWQRGALLYVVGNVLQFFSYAFAAQTLLLALSSVQFVTHLVAARFLEGIAVPRRSIAAAAIILVANAVLVVFGSKVSQLFTAVQLVALHRCDPVSCNMRVSGSTRVSSNV